MTHPLISFCALPDRERASASLCTLSLDVCCLHPHWCSVLTSNTENHNQAIDVVYSSTAQYNDGYLKKFGCAPNGGFIKDKGAAEKDCAPAPDCEIFGSKCCEENSSPASSCDDNSPDCVLFGVGCCEDRSTLKESPCVPDKESCIFLGEGCCEEEAADEGQVFGDRQRNSGLLMAMAFCVKIPNVYVTAN